LDFLKTALQFLGAVVGVGGGLVALTYVIIRTMATKWIDHRFAQSLEAFRHAHQEELEKLKFRINAEFDRLTILHKQEFEVLPEAWANLSDAFNAARRFVSSFQSYPDLDALSKEAQKEFLTSSRLAEWQKSEILQTDEKTKSYIKYIFWADIDLAQSASRKSSRFLLQRGIFIEENLLKKFKELDDLIFKAIQERELNERIERIPKNMVEIEALGVAGQKLLEALEVDVHRRLWAVAVS
jgi:hypothetical protein